MLLVASPAPHGAVVIVDDRGAHASNDGGLTYRTILPAATAQSVVDAAVGADGALYALRDDALDIERGGRVTTRVEMDARRVAVSGRTIAVLRAGGVDVSLDGGATFVTRALPAPCAGCESDLREMIDFTVAGGSPYLVETSINTCTSSDFLEWQRLVQAGAVTAQRSLAVPKADFAAGWRFGAYGWMYGITYADRLVAVSSAGAVPIAGFAGLGTSAPATLTIAHNDRVTVAAIGSALVELNGARARVLDAHAKATDYLAVDGDDRPLVSDGKELWRFSRVTGWSKLAMP